MNDAIAQEVDKIEQLIHAARQLLAERQLVDLSALEGRVRALCDAFGAASAEETQNARPRIEAVMAELDALEVEVNERHQAVQREIASTSRSAAAKAYGPPSSKDES